MLSKVAPGGYVIFDSNKQEMRAEMKYIKATFWVDTDINGWRVQEQVKSKGGCGIKMSFSLRDRPYQKGVDEGQQ